MKIATSIAEIRHLLSASSRLGFVPTMGNLHAGHLHLVKKGQQIADEVVVSIFVNPLQFDRADDLAAYPRTLEQDIAQLEALGVDYLFAPDTTEIYPQAMQQHTQVVVPQLSDILCGAYRPGHFMGVTTIVSKLFNIIRPQWAVFGKKDYQQLMLIQKMVRDLAFDIEIIAVDTVREPDGLAMSSRNQYLSPAERQKAPILYQSLQSIAAELRSGRLDFATLEQQGADMIEQAGLKVDYFSIRQTDLSPARPDTSPKVILTAAFLGKARLIDNLEVQQEAQDETMRF